MLDTYSHLWPDSEERTREAVDEAWRGAVVPPVCPQEEAVQQRCGVSAGQTRLRERATDESACMPGTDPGLSAGVDNH